MRRSPKKRRSQLVRAIWLTVGSLTSHLEYSIKATPRMVKDGETEAFHSQCVREYAEVIQICAKELETLAPKPKKSKKLISLKEKVATLQAGTSTPPTTAGPLQAPTPSGQKTEARPSKSASTQSLTDKKL